MRSPGFPDESLSAAAWYVAEGGCMRPFVRSGDFVAVEKYARGTPAPRRGDCIVFEAAEKKFMHRVVGKTSGGYFAADDAGFTEPAFVPAGAVLGVCRVFPSGFGGYLWCLAARLFFRSARFAKNSVKFIFER